MREYRKRSFKSYLLVACLLGYVVNWLIGLYELSPDTRSLNDLLGVGRFDWIASHLIGTKPLLDFSFSIWSLMGVGMVFFMVFLQYLKVSDSRLYRSGEEHGSARFANIGELRRFSDPDETYNLILSQEARLGIDNRRLDYNNHLNKNLLLVGPPGEGKTRTFVLPNILQLNSSFVLTDPKGLTVHQVGQLLEKEDYQIKIFDLVNLANSNQFNAFHYVQSELDIDRMADAITSGTAKTNNKGEDFWIQAENLLIRSLLAYLYFDGAVLGNYEPNISQVADLLRCLKREDPEVKSIVEMMFEQLEEDLPGNYANKQFDLFMSNFSGQTLMSVLAIASSRFSVFDHESVQKMVSRDNMEIETWQLKKTAVFIAIPETDKTYNFLANLLFTTMLRVLPRIADEILQGKNEAVSPDDLLHICLRMDEFAQLGAIPNFVESQSSGRSREISMEIILQALNQIKSAYKDDWKTIINNCSTLVYLGTNDDDTMKYFSMRAGKQTISQRNQSRTYSTANGSSSENIQTLSRDLLTPDEVARIPLDESLVYLSRQHVFKNKKYRLESHPRFDELAGNPSSKKWYRYQRFMTELEEWEAGVLHSYTISVKALQD